MIQILYKRSLKPNIDLYIIIYYINEAYISPRWLNFIGHHLAPQWTQDQPAAPHSIGTSAVKLVF